MSVGPSAHARPFPLITRVAAASIAVAVLVAAVFIALLLALSALRDSTARARHAKDVTAGTLTLEKHVLELETSLRGFVITGNELFLAGFRHARRELPAAIARLDALTEDEAERRRAHQLGVLVRAYVDDYAVPLVAIARRDPEAARASVATAEGRLRLAAISTRFTELLAIEDRIATERSTSAERQADRAVAIGVGALVATALLILLAGLYLTRRVARPVRDVARAATDVAGGDLTARAPEGGAGEVRQLTHAFNEMAASLEAGRRELQEQYEQLRQSERLRSELVSIVSHELRTPLASVLGYASLLLSRDFDEDTRQRYLKMIRAEGQRIATLVDDLVDLRRAESGGLRLEEETLDLAPLLESQVALFAGRSGDHQLELRLPDGPLRVHGDVGRLEQVVSNLLANAIKYSPAGGPVEITATRLGAGGIRVEVTDRGIGIPQEHQTQVFTKFFRGEARASGISGAGLGLAISREIVESHGGRIGFRSAAGEGSTFWVELPAAPPAEDLLRAS